MKYKLCKKNQFVAIALTTTTILTAGTLCYHKSKNERIHQTVNHPIGYQDVNPLTNKLVNKLTTDDFVLLNIGDHNTDGVYFLNQKLNYCQENHIHIGLILSPTKNTSLDLYLDLEFIKEIVSTYPIQYPIYLDVDPIFNDPSITYQEAKNLIEGFLQKAKENHLYIGLFGSSDYLVDYPEKHLYIKDNVSLTTLQSVNHQQQYLTIPQNIIEEIQENHYNDPQLLKEDEYFTYIDSTSLKEVAKEYNISINTILKYNHLYFNNSPKTDQILRIPTTTYQEKRHLNKNQPTKIGIDVSKWQEAIEWQELDIDFAIIQLRDFINKENDPMFLRNIQGCLTNNIPMGFYIFSRATTIEELKQEINITINELKDIPVTYPIYLDLETEFWYDFMSNPSQENVTFIHDFIKTWDIEISQASYTPGLYCSQSLYNHLNTSTNHYLDHISCWIAGGEYYDTPLNINEDSLPSVENTEQVSMKQISSKGQISGIVREVDVNYYYVNELPLTKPLTHHFVRLDHEIEYGTKFLLGTGILFITSKRRKKKKSREKKNHQH